jgi:hypothetical protein
MKYVMLIYQGAALERQAALPEEEQKQVYADYQGINQTPGFTPMPPMGLPENATTVRVEGGKTLTTDGPFAAIRTGHDGTPGRSSPGAPNSTARSPCAAAGPMSCRPPSPRCTPRCPATGRRSRPCTASSPA